MVEPTGLTPIRNSAALPSSTLSFIIPLTTEGRVGEVVETCDLALDHLRVVGDAREAGLPGHRVLVAGS